MVDNEVASASDDTHVRVERVLDGVLAGVRQRQAELATVTEDLKDLPEALARAHQIQYIQEPECVSHRPVIGRVIVWAKKAVYHAFMKWYLQAFVEQQNEFNRCATLALRDLFGRQKSLAQESRRLGEKLDALCRASELENP